MSRTCYIVGASDAPDLYIPIEIGDAMVIAADGGLDHLHRPGMEHVKPDIVLGDFDSCGSDPQSIDFADIALSGNHTSSRIVRFPAEKDDTDMALAVREGLKNGCDQFFIFGGLGGARMEHTLGNIQVLADIAMQGARGFLLGEGYVMTIIKDTEISFPDTLEGFISLIPIAAKNRKISIEGLKYSGEDFELDLGQTMGMSNEFTGDLASVSVGEGMLLVIWREEPKSLIHRS